MTRQLLHRLADFLETEIKNKKKFDMTAWKCGSACCAIGWACEYGIFPGLEMKWSPQMMTHFIVYCGVQGFDGISKLFEITFDEVRFLFSTGRYSDFDPKIDEVIQRIRSFANAH